MPVPFHHPTNEIPGSLPLQRRKISEEFNYFAQICEQLGNAGFPPEEAVLYALEQAFKMDEKAGGSEG